MGAASTVPAPTGVATSEPTDDPVSSSVSMGSSTASSTISSSTQKLLENMIKDAGLTSRHSRQLNSMRGGTLGRGRKTATAILREVESNPVERAPRGAFKDRESEKDRFATLMQYQGAVPEVQKRAGGDEALRTRTKHYCPPGSNKGMNEGDVDWNKRFGELAKDVEENQAFLVRMEAAGQGHAHRAVVNGTIAERYREMREIDKKLEERAAMPR
ncbi:hypothetical protein T484DRAFT_1791587 [Baffinella frigidus]|nr:hypothetical protein T484DRAFT_1791587 [Cryptophyta sp. CCMP2293]